MTTPVTHATILQLALANASDITEALEWGEQKGTVFFVDHVDTRLRSILGLCKDGSCLLCIIHDDPENPTERDKWETFGLADADALFLLLTEPSSHPTAQEALSHMDADVKARIISALTRARIASCLEAGHA